MSLRYYGQLRHIISQYKAAGEIWPATTRQIASWAIRQGLWGPQKSAVVGLCAEQLARAMRGEFFIDPQGRNVRAKHAARISRDGEQLVLWDDIRTASREHMGLAFQQRRHQIVGDCRQLKVDVDSYNENRNPGEPIQLVFDFRLDLMERELESSVV
jgi:hypothetical protein